MIKLWVDDIRNPESFRPGEDWHWAKTITEAVRILATQHVTDVSLDHDITHPILPGDDNGKNIYQPVCCPENYTAVAYFIAAMTVDERPVRVYVHTANPAGSGEIHNILRGCMEMGMEVIRRAA